MRNLLVSLRESDAALLPVIARFWGIDISKLEASEIPAVLDEAMLDPERAARIWEKLDDIQRGTLQTLIGGMNAGRMPMSMFERMFGEIRKMGAGAIEREKPLEDPTSTAEALYYRGLIYEGYEQTPTGLRHLIYVPPDFSAVLPTHKTAYDNLDDGDEGDFPHPAEPNIEEIDAELLEDIHPADTTIVDDMATLLAYLQVHGAAVDQETLADSDHQALTAYLLNPDEARLSFLFGLGISADLIEVQQGRAYPRRAEARRWLEGKRAAQLKLLAESWRESKILRDLWHVPGLHPEPTGWPYAPAAAREAVLGFLREFVPQQGWWSLDEFITTVKEIDPDFQRPGGDYESWYIRNDAGDYLNGFESWDAVEGALLEFYMAGPMHWLGMVDLAEDAARLTAYGRAFVNQETWPSQPETEEKIIVQDDGTLLASRRVPRFDRFQVMRFTTWSGLDRQSDLSSATSHPFVYKLNAEGIRRASEQGINTGHIAAFITRMLDNAPVPLVLSRLLETWQTGPASSVTMENLLVLRTTAPETLDYILDTPALRRYLGAKLGPMAVIIRADQWELLRDALGEHGIEVDLIG